LQQLDDRCQRVMEAIIIPLKGKEEAQISSELIDSLGRLTQCEPCIYLPCLRLMIFTEGCQSYAKMFKNQDLP
jgi:hypothetical protein